MSRFSLVLLEEGELFFEEFAVYLCLPDPSDASRAFIKNPIPGILRICSHSLVVEPTERISLPLTRYPYSAIKNMEVVLPQLRPFDPDTSTLNTAPRLVIDSDSEICMRKNGKDHPYFVNTQSFKRFIIFRHASDIQGVLRRLTGYEQIHKLPFPEMMSKQKEIVNQLHSTLSFDRQSFHNIDESVVFRSRVETFGSFVKNEGLLVLSNQHIYLKLIAIIDSRNLLTYSLANLAYAQVHTIAGQNLGCELWFDLPQIPDPHGGEIEGWNFDDGDEFNDRSIDFLWKLPSILLKFPTEEARDIFISNLRPQKTIPISDELRRAWTEGEISNFGYLMALNYLSGRSLRDLSQYPVLPWVIADYTCENLDLTDPSVFRDLSKPMGALNEIRLAELQCRFTDMEFQYDTLRNDPMYAPLKSSEEYRKGYDPMLTSTIVPFLYGSHYSTPGYVLHFLVRKRPALMLALQHGTFDQPERAFSSIQRSYGNALLSSADVKELIPEFYSDFDSADEWLTNHEALQLGRTQSHELIGDVRLPPWARTPKEFVKKNREALESDYVSQHLHHWIDLVFGYASRGPEARSRHNIYCALTYPEYVSSVSRDYKRMFEYMRRSRMAQRDPDACALLQQSFYGFLTQVNEFGQCPQQLFFEPHSPKTPEETSEKEDAGPLVLSVLPTEFQSPRVVLAHLSVLTALSFFSGPVAGFSDGQVVFVSESGLVMRSFNTAINCFAVNQDFSSIAISFTNGIAVLDRQLNELYEVPYCEEVSCMYLDGNELVVGFISGDIFIYENGARLWDILEFSDPISCITKINSDVIVASDSVGSIAFYDKRQSVVSSMIYLPTSPVTLGGCSNHLFCIMSREIRVTDETGFDQVTHSLDYCVFAAVVLPQALLILGTDNVVRILSISCDEMRRLPIDCTAFGESLDFAVITPSESFEVAFGSKTGTVGHWHAV